MPAKMPQEPPEHQQTPSRAGPATQHPASSTQVKECWQKAPPTWMSAILAPSMRVGPPAACAGRVSSTRPFTSSLSSIVPPGLLTT